MTDLVWLTRADKKGLYNAALEAAFNNDEEPYASPVGTEWAFGNLADYQDLDYVHWVDLEDWVPTDTIGRPLVVHLVEEDIYLQLTFTSWTDGSGLGGGGFSYVRSTPPGTEVERRMTLWTGPETFFRKDNYGDYTDSDQQDRLTESVWLTRQDKRGLYNAALESAFDYDAYVTSSPEGHRWAFWRSF